MNMSIKGTIAAIMAVIMMMTSNNIILAVDDEDLSPPTVNRTLSIDFMGRGITPADISPGRAQLNKSDVNNPFWVGVAVDKVNDLDLFTEGIYSMELAFEYDPDYVIPYYDGSTDWETILKNENLKSTLWSSDLYEIISVNETDIDTTSDRENLELAKTRAADGWKMCTVCVTLKDGALTDNMRFKDLVDSSKQYLLKLPFLLVNAPDESSAERNPTVLSFVRGPETFDIGSGVTGTDPSASWEASPEDRISQKNLRNLFNFPGDIDLFGVGGSIENIIAVKPMEVDESADTEYVLSTTKSLTEDGFKEENLTYYVSVSNDAKQIRLDITSSEQPTVIANSIPVQTSLESDRLYKTDLFDIAEMDKDIDADGFNNTVTVQSGDKTYTIYIRRLLQPRIELNYGNSPYGEIMRAENIANEDKQAAKDAFNTNNKYSTNYLPEGCDSKIVYTTFAWNEDVQSSTEQTDPAINLDRDDYALFVYQGDEFIDPGVTAYNSMGEVVDDSQITRTMSIKVMKSNDIRYMADDQVDNKIVSSTGSGDYTFSDIKNISMRPDVFDMEYSFVDDATNETVTATRKVVSLWTVGDANLSTVFNASDASVVTQIIKGSAKPLEGVTGVTPGLYYYRILDVNYSRVVNSTDASVITQMVKGSSPRFDFYKAITIQGG